MTAIPGVRFSNTGQSQNHLRISIAFHATDTLKEAVRTLCTALLQYNRAQGGRIATVAGELQIRRQLRDYKILVWILFHYLRTVNEYFTPYNVFDSRGT